MTPRQNTASEIRRLEYDHHFNSTSSTGFHGGHTDLCIRVVQIMSGKSSETFCSCLGGRTGDRDLVNKWMRKGGLNRTWCNVTRDVANGVMYLI